MEAIRKLSLTDEVTFIEDDAIYPLPAFIHLASSDEPSDTSLLGTVMCAGAIKAASIIGQKGGYALVFNVGMEPPPLTHMPVTCVCSPVQTPSFARCVSWAFANSLSITRATRKVR